MSMIRWDPFADMAQLREQVNRLFEQSLTHSGHEPVTTQSWAPALDIVETADAITLYVELPGIDPAGIDIQMAGDTLTLKGERRAPEEHGRQFIRVERNYGAFQRAFTLGVPIEAAGIHAVYTDGVLEVTLPKREAAKPKQVKIEVQPGRAPVIDATP